MSGAANIIGNMPTHVCERCHESFFNKNSTRKFCSTACYWDARRASARTAPPPPSVIGARWIALSSGRFTLVDESDYATIGRLNWFFDGMYASTKAVPHNVRLHRVLLGKPPIGLVTDHCNRNKLDNRRSNLRFVPQSVNVANTVSARTMPLHYRGVQLKPGGRWAAKYRNVILGRFRTAEDAARAYDRAVRDDHPNMSVVVNFPEEP